MWLYVVSESVNGPCKIGFADRIGNRLSSLQSGNPRALTLDYTMETINYRMAERVAHSLVWRHRISGEWFDITTTQAINAVKTACDQAEASRVRRGWLDAREALLHLQPSKNETRPTD